MPPARFPARAHPRQVLRAPPLACKCELPGQVRGCRRAPAPPRRHRQGRPAARLPRLHSCPPPPTTGHCWHGPVSWGPRPAHAQPGRRAAGLPRVPSWPSSSSTPLLPGRGRRRASSLLRRRFTTRSVGALWAPHWGNGWPKRARCGPSKMWAVSLQWIIRKCPCRRKDKGGKQSRSIPS